MSIQLKTINNEQVTAMPLPNANLEVKGADLCSECYANIALIAKKKSGKTNALFHLLKQTIGKGTEKVFIFCTTLYKDSAWVEIRKWLEKKKIDYEGFTSLTEDGVNQIAEIVDRLNVEAEEAENAPVEKPKQQGGGKTVDDIFEQLKVIGDRLGHFTHMQQTGGQLMPSAPKKKKRKEKLLCPQYFVILDDIGNQLKNSALTTLLNWNRHYKAKVIISTQYLNHLVPDSRKMIDLFLIFKGQPEKKLREIYEDTDVSIPFETFEALYKKATELPFSFFYIDTRNEVFRRNFNTQFILPESD